MITPIQKTEVLLEAMPWLRSYRGATVVIKYGGNAMINEDLRRAFAADIQFLHQVGLRPVAVSYTHLTLPTILRSCRSRWSPYH